MRRADRALGIGLGIVLGLVIVTGFVFIGSRETIDDPGVSGAEDRSGDERPATRVPVVRVEGGAPPGAGPARLEARLGEPFRFRVVSDAALNIEIVALGFRRTLRDGATPITLRPRRRGQFPVVVAGSAIGIASLHVR